MCAQVFRITGVKLALEGVYRWIFFMPSKQDPQRPVATRYFGVFDDGSFIVAAAFTGEITLGEGEANETALSSGGPYMLGMYLARYTAAGELEWAVLADTAAKPRSVAVRDDGGFAVLAEDNVLTYGPDGEPIWSAQLFCSDYNIDPRGFWTADHHLIVGSTFWVSLQITDSADASTVLYAPVETDGSITVHAGAFAIAGFSPEGALSWATTTDNPDVDNCASMSGMDLASDGGIIIVGYLNGTVTFGAGGTNETALSAALPTDSFVARYLVDGTLDWAKRFNPGADAERFELAAIAADEDGSYTVCGAFEGTIDLSLVEGETATFTASPDTNQLVVTKICL